jgi:hypothetical protein
VGWAGKWLRGRRKEIGIGSHASPAAASGTRGQTGLPAHFRQTAPEIHGSLVSPRRAPWVQAVFRASMVKTDRSFTKPQRR